MTPSIFTTWIHFLAWLCSAMFSFISWNTTNWHSIIYIMLCSSKRLEVHLDQLLLPNPTIGGFSTSNLQLDLATKFQSYQESKVQSLKPKLWRVKVSRYEKWKLSDKVTKFEESKLWRDKVSKFTESEFVTKFQSYKVPTWARWWRVPSTGCSLGPAWSGTCHRGTNQERASSHVNHSRPMRGQSHLMNDLLNLALSSSCSMERLSNSRPGLVPRMVWMYLMMYGFYITFSEIFSMKYFSQDRLYGRLWWFINL